MEHLNKLDCEYTLEEAKDVDVNDITTHPFFKKHFKKGQMVRRLGGYSFEDHDEYSSDKYHKHVIRHYKPEDKNDHLVEIATAGRNGQDQYFGAGRHKTAHGALEHAIKAYNKDVHKVKPLTESLVTKKPATASKLFAEEMAARLDEISKKTLGSYVKKAAYDVGEIAKKEERARAARSGLPGTLNFDRKETGEAIWNAVHAFDKEADKHSNKKYKRQSGIHTAIKKLTKEDLDEVEAPANFWNAGMARMNPIQVSQKQPAEPGQFKATLTKSPKRLADQDSSLEGKPRAVRDETETVAASRGPKTIELTGDWHADVPDHQFDPKLDSETEYYPLFSQFKSLGAYPSGPARAWESEEIEEDELNEISKNVLKSYLKKAKSQKRGLSVKIDNDFKKMQHATDWSPESEAMKAANRTNSISRKYHTRNSGIQKAAKKLSEDELNELSKKTLSKYVDVAADKLAGHAYLAGGGSGSDKEGKTKEFRKAVNRLKGIKLANKKLSEDSASLMATATKDEKKAAEQDKKKPSEFKKLHDKHETEVKAKMKELGEEALDEGLFDPAKQPLLALWDEHARRSDAHGSGSRTEILKRIEDHVAKKHGQEGLKKMKLHTDLTNALKHSLSPDKGHLQAILGNMRSRCAMGV